MGQYPKGFIKQQKCELLRRIFGPRRDEVIEVRRKLHNEELENCTLR
jgi:hypothetical protein